METHINLNGIIEEMVDKKAGVMCHILDCVKLIPSSQ